MKISQLINRLERQLRKAVRVNDRVAIATLTARLDKLQMAYHLSFDL